MNSFSITDPQGLAASIMGTDRLRWRLILKKSRGQTCSVDEYYVLGDRDFELGIVLNEGSVKVSGRAPEFRHDVFTITGDEARTLVEPFLVRPAAGAP